MLKVENLRKVFRTEEIETIALNGVSFDVDEGEFVAVMGPSGCGKSTLLNILGLLDNPTSGSYSLLGQEVAAFRERDRTKFRKGNIGFVFQSFNLIDELNVFENVELPLIYMRVKAAERKRRVNEILGRMNISHRAEHFPQQLSGGQQQRVAIARALVTGPAIICMDEPLSNLDAKLRVQLRNELKKMQKDFGITTIYVTHDQEEALTLSDRIAVFNKGFIEQIGTPNEVYNHSQTEFVCNFIGDINRLNDDTVSALRAAGAEVDASKHNYIRLERLHVNVAPRGGEIALDGTVESCEYYGLYIKYYIHVGTQSLKVIEKNDGVNIYDPGQRVKVILNPNDIMAYAPSAEEVE